MTAMESLEAAVWDECVYRLAAPDQTALERWQSDPLAAYREHFQVHPLPARYAALLDHALAEWDRVEQVLLQHIGLTAEAFDARFRLIRDGLRKEDEQRLRAGSGLGRVAYGAVRNLDIVNCFACFLPRAVSHRRNELAKRGQRIAAVFYLERIAKVGFAACSEKVDAAWQYAGALIDE